MPESKDDNAQQLKAEVERALARIAEQADANALKRMYANIQRHRDIDELDRERLTEATMLRLRVISPAVATRLGGPKDASGREFIQSAYEKLATTFDLSGNMVGQGVKTGGYMINGTRFVDVYLSYKTGDGRNLSFAWIQEDAASKPYLELLLRHVGKDCDGEDMRQVFTDEYLAVSRLVEEMSALIGA